METIIYNAIDLAWVAGLLEGEGSFTLQSKRYPRLTCGSVDLDVLQKLQSILQCGHIRYNTTTVTGKTFYLYKISQTKQVLQICKLLYPFMSLRRKAQIDSISS